MDSAFRSGRRMEIILCFFIVNAIGFDQLSISGLGPSKGSISPGGILDGYCDPVLSVCTHFYLVACSIQSDRPLLNDSCS